MSLELTRPGKHSLILDCPVMPAAGTVGYGDRYDKLIKPDKWGAIITDPVTLKPRQAARGTHVVPLPGGVLMHTGMPNPGVNKVLKEYTSVWRNSAVPVIVHVLATHPTEVERCARALDACTAVAGIELGLHHRATAEEAQALIQAALAGTQLPLLVRLPLEQAAELAPIVARTGAGAIVVGAPPRGIARDPLSGRLVNGRVFGPLVKPIALRTVGQVIQALGKDSIPVIGAGGIHSPQDARDFIEQGARAVQLDSVIWVRPHIAEVIARDLGGLELTRAANAYPDEWYPGIGLTDVQSMTPPPPKDLPE